MKSIIIAAACIALAGCATNGTSGIGRTACKHRGAISAGLEMAKARAYAIEDPVAREAAVSALNVSLVALDGCPA